jgi:hypothetical protein
MGSNDQEKIKIAREYFMRADQGRPDILELFNEDAEVYFPKFGFGFGRNSFLEMVKGFEEPWNTFNTTTTVSLSFLQPTISSLKALHRAECRVSRGQGQSSWRPFLQRLQVSRWPNIEPAHLT